MSPLSRREFLWLSGSALLASCVHGPFAPVRTNALLIPAYRGSSEKPESYFLAKIKLPSMEYSRVELPMLGHGLALHPEHSHLVLVFGKRNQKVSCLVDVEKLQVLRTFPCDQSIGFYGHGCFNRAGTEFYCSEAGVGGDTLLVRRSFQDFRVLDRHATKGFAPHDVQRLPHSDELLVTNGLPHLANQGPSFASRAKWADPKNAQQFILQAQASVEHLVQIGPDSFAVALVGKGKNPQTAPKVALKFKDQKELVALKLPKEFESTDGDRTLSAARCAQTGVLGFTFPNGQHAHFWSERDGAYRGTVALKNPCGIVSVPDQEKFYFSSGDQSLTAVDIHSLQIQSRWNFLAAGEHWESHIYSI